MANGGCESGGGLQRALFSLSKSCCVVDDNSSHVCLRNARTAGAPASAACDGPRALQQLQQLQVLHAAWDGSVYLGREERAAG